MEQGVMGKPSPAPASLTRYAHKENVKLCNLKEELHIRQAMLKAWG